MNGISNVFVSVVMPVYNSANFLAEAIESILSQTYSNFEFIIVDDASTDESLSVITTYLLRDNRIKLLRNAENLKIAKTLNKGIAYAAGKYIVRMDADDISVVNRIERQVSFMEWNQSIGVSGAQAGILETDDVFAKTFYLTDQEIRASLLFGTGIIHPTAIIRKSVLNKLDICYNPDFDFADDVELWFRISKISELANQPDVLLRYRRHEANWTSVHRRKIEKDVSKLRMMLYEYYLNYQLTDNDIDILKSRSDSNLQELILFYSRILKSYSSNVSSRFFSRQLLARVFSKDIFLRIGERDKISILDFLVYLFAFFTIDPNNKALKNWMYWGIKRKKFFR